MEIHSELNKKLVSDEYSCFTRQLSQLLKLLCSTLYRSMDHGCSRIWKNLEKILIICHQEFHNETLLRIKSLTFYILRKTWEKFLNFYPFWCFRDVGGRNPDGNREDNNFNSFNVLLIHKMRTVQTNTFVRSSVDPARISELFYLFPLKASLVYLSR